MKARSASVKTPWTIFSTIRSASRRVSKRSWSRRDPSWYMGTSVIYPSCRASVAITFSPSYLNAWAASLTLDWEPISGPSVSARAGHLRLPDPPTPSRRPPGASPAGLVVVQIDGLSYRVRSRARGRTHALRRKDARQGRVPPSPDECRHADLHAGVSDGRDVRCATRYPGVPLPRQAPPFGRPLPRAGHAAGVEAAHVEGRVGILRGGSVYGCVFTGGAENDLFSFAKLTRPSGPGVVRCCPGSSCSAGSR